MIEIGLSFLSKYEFSLLCSGVTYYFTFTKNNANMYTCIKIQTNKVSLQFEVLFVAQRMVQMSHVQWRLPVYLFVFADLTIPAISLGYVTVSDCE